MVFINVFRIAAVMNAVMRRRVEDVFEPAHFVNRLRMNPKLIKGIQRRD